MAELRFRILVLHLLREALVRTSGNLVRIEFTERRRLSALLPDDAVVGLCRELILERMYDIGSLEHGSELIVDAGAHVGLYTLMASDRARRVVAIEADQVNFRTLELNLALNQVSNVTTMHAALWSSDGEVRFLSTTHSEGGAISANGAPMASVSLDRVVQDYGAIDLLKIDVEGAEFEVLGQTRVLDAIGCIVAELHVSEDSERRALITHLERSGYAITLIPAAYLASARQAPKLIRNWRRLHGRPLLKAAALIYLLLPGAGSTGKNGTRELPLLIARRRQV